MCAIKVLILVISVRVPFALKILPFSNRFEFAKGLWKITGKVLSSLRSILSPKNLNSFQAKSNWNGEFSFETPCAREKKLMVHHGLTFVVEIMEFTEISVFDRTPQKHLCEELWGVQGAQSEELRPSSVVLSNISPPHTLLLSRLRGWPLCPQSAETLIQPKMEKIRLKVHSYSSPMLIYFFQLRTQKKMVWYK